MAIALPQMQTAAQLIMGEVSPVTGMAVGPIEHGTLSSMDGYGAGKFEGQVVNGANVFYKTPLGVKLDFRSVIKPEEGEVWAFENLPLVQLN